MSSRARKKVVPPKDLAPKPRELSKQETREALLKAGVEAFSKEGLDAPSLDAICERAGFTRGAFYVHFEDREDFIVAVMESATRRFLDTILAADGEALDLEVVVRTFAAAMSSGRFRVFGEVPPHQILAACARFPALRERYQGLVAESVRRLVAGARAGQRTGKVRDDVDAGALARMLVAVALGVEVLREIGAPFDAEEYATAVTRMMGR
jgi:TetR/AcrR family transcriptional regulator, transcriptional repressor for nem operon